MKKSTIIPVIALLCLVVIILFIFAIYSPLDNSYNSSAITGEQRTNAIKSTILYDRLVYGKMLDNDTYQDYQGINYTFGRIVPPSPDYYIYNKSKQLLVVPVKITNDSSNLTLYYTVDLAKNETITVFEDYGDVSGLTYQEKMQAIKMALNDSYVKDVLSEKDPYYIVSVHPISLSEAGYVNYTGKIARVDISGGRMILKTGDNFRGGEVVSAIIPGIAFNILVDYQNNRELDMFQYYPSPIDAEPTIPETAIIPEGAYKYHKILVNRLYSVNDSFYPKFTIGVRFEPADAKLYAAIVDSKNLQKFINGSPYESTLFVDQSTNQTSQYNFSGPIKWGWTADVQMQRLSSPIYLILKNDGTEDVRLEYVDVPVGSNPNLVYSLIDPAYNHTMRNYSHSIATTSNGVTIYILENFTQDRLNFHNGAPGIINITEDVYYDGGNSSSSAIRDYVRFTGDDNRPVIYIDLSRTTNETSTDVKAYANVDIFLPRFVIPSVHYADNSSEFPK